MKKLWPVLILFLWITPAQADYLYEYDFQGEGPYLTYTEINFGWTVPSLITVTTEFQVGDLDYYSSIPFNLEKIVINDPFNADPSYPAPSVTLFFEGFGAGLTTFGYYQPFDDIGTYLNYNMEHHGTIKISSVNSPVPEPSTVILLCAGLFGLVGSSRKKFFKR